MDDRHTKWFKSLKPGDEVAINSGYGRGTYRIAKVESVTPTGRVRVDHYEFDANGRRRGGHRYDPVNIEPITDEVRDAMFRERTVNTLAHFTKWALLTSDQLKRILAIVEEGREP